MSKKHTYIGAVSTDTSQHIIRQRDGVLCIIRRFKDVQYWTYVIGNCTFHIPQDSRCETLIKVSLAESRATVTANLDLATFLHRTLETNHE